MDILHYEPATIAILGAAILLIISKEDPHHVLRELEWPTLFLFIGLFIIVGGVIKVGLISQPFRRHDFTDKTKRRKHVCYRTYHLVVFCCQLGNC